MAIDPDVRRIAAQMGSDPTCIQAVELQEGNILRAVQCSLPTVQTREKALEVTCRSANNALWRFLAARNLQGEFIAEWGKKWAPLGVANDPTNLNKNWVPGVRALWQKLREASK